MAVYDFEISEHIGTVDSSSREVNLVSWGSNNPKIDIRSWRTTSKGRVPNKGITLSVQEARELVDLLSDYLDRTGQ